MPRKARTTMKQIIPQEAFQMLRQAGFTEAEIDRLYQLRQAYQTSELDQPPLDLGRLQFIRWLVATGRLTEDLPETRDQAVPRLNPVPACFTFPYESPDWPDDP